MPIGHVVLKIYMSCKNYMSYHGPHKTLVSSNDWYISTKAIMSQYCCGMHEAGWAIHAYGISKEIRTAAVW